MSHLSIPSVVFPPMGFSESFSLANLAGNAPEKQDADSLKLNFGPLEDAVALRTAELRRNSGATLLAIQQVYRLGLPLDADQVAEPYEKEFKVATSVFDGLQKRLNDLRKRRPELADGLMGAQRKVRSLAASVQGALADAIALLREAAAKTQREDDGVGARSYGAYVDAFEAHMPGARVTGIRPLFHHGDVTPVLVITLSEKISTKELVRIEQLVHDQVYDVDPNLAGVFAIEYDRP